MYYNILSNFFKKINIQNGISQNFNLIKFSAVHHTYMLLIYINIKYFFIIIIIIIIISQGVYVGGRLIL
jgi:hypothetical protein